VGEVVRFGRARGQGFQLPRKFGRLGKWRVTLCDIGGEVAE
jgi:hypothetical protein